MSKFEKKLKKKSPKIKQERRQLHLKKITNSLEPIKTTGDMLDVTEEMINMFIRFEIQRRYFTII